MWRRDKFFAKNKRLAYEPLAKRHALMLFSEISDPLLYRFIAGNAPRSVVELATRYARLGNGPLRSDLTWHNWAMLDGPNAIGTLHAVVSENLRALVSCLVCRRHWDHGYATEGVRWMLNQLAVDGVERAEAYIDTRNAAAITVVTRLGFRLRTIVRQAELSDAPMSEECVYELEFPTMRRGS
ncbi:MAG: GNAT family N-acetyltransferase [Kofleriaceae bacterium]